MQDMSFDEDFLKFKLADAKKFNNFLKLDLRKKIPAYKRQLISRRVRTEALIQKSQ